MQRGVSPINEYEHDQRLQSLKRVQQVSAHKLLYDVISPNIKHVTHGETSGQAQVRPQGCTHTSEYETRCRLFGERTSARTTGRSLFICCGCSLFSLSCIRYIIARISQKSRQNFSPHPQTIHYYPARRSDASQPSPLCPWLSGTTLRGLEGLELYTQFPTAPSEHSGQYWAAPVGLGQRGYRRLISLSDGLG